MADRERMVGEMTLELLHLENGHRQMLEGHAEWLNGWARYHGEVGAEELSVNLESYWLEEDDCPRLLADLVYEEERRLVAMSATPFHDEGGPCTLTGWLVWDDGQRWVEWKSAPGEWPTTSFRNEQVEEPRWELVAMVQEFDGMHELIAAQGRVFAAELRR